MRTVLTTLAALSLLVSGCGRSNDQHSAVGSHAKKTIGVSVLTLTNPFFKVIGDTLTEEAAKHGYEVIVTSGEFDVAKQQNQVKDFIVRGVGAIVLCPCDSKAIGPVIQEANAAGIPVFTADIAAQEGDVVCHVASDNVAGGRLAGEYLAKILNGAGNVAIIGQPTVTSVLDRVQGFKDAIAKFPNIKIVADVNGEGVRDKALQVTSDILQAQQHLSGIFGINDDSALGALDAVTQFKRTNIFIIGYDATPPAADAIIKGTALKADVIQYPKKIGATTIEKIRQYFSGAQVPKIIPVEVGIADKEALSTTTTK